MSSVKSYIVLLAILYYIVAIHIVSARTIHENDHEKHRHRRRSYDYDRYYDRIDSNRQREELFTEITRTLQEISLSIRRPPSPPPPPQIIYVPYFIPHPVRVSCSENVTTPDLGNRIRRPYEDPFQVWGSIPGNVGQNLDNGYDGARPIYLDSIEPSEPLPKMPPVEHGSSQAGMKDTTTTTAPPVKSRMCQAAIVICCSEADEISRKKCFTNYGCFKTYATGISCHKTIVKQALDEFTNAFGPQ